MDERGRAAHGLTNELAPLLGGISAYPHYRLTSISPQMMSKPPGPCAASAGIAVCRRNGLSVRASEVDR
jgi:hypothetical protein